MKTQGLGAPRFDVHPSVVFKLGEDLITDELQALLELVKNSYDAKASYANVVIDTRASLKEEFPDTFFPGEVGYVRITDDGEGMSLEDITSAWMVVSNSPKRRAKADRRFASSERVPLGDKGLGRLGAQRIAKTVEVYTSTDSRTPSNHVGFEWGSFTQHHRLGDIPVQSAQSGSRKRGTTLLLGGLLEPERWLNKRRIEERLAELISPFSGVEKFELVVTVDGTELDVAEITRNMRGAADSAFRLVFDGERLTLSGKVKLRALTPAESTRRNTFQTECEADGGAKLFEYLAKGIPESRIRKSRSAAWFVEFAESYSLADLEDIELDAAQNPVSPGRFEGEVDAFSLAASRVKEQELFEASADYKNYVKTLAGVRVYRDGFGIRVDRDFLNLSQQQTTGRSWYGLRPGNTIGFISISARDNPQLVETTDREGFKDTPAHRNFRLLLDKFVEFTARVLESARRRTTEYCDMHISSEGDIEPGWTPEQTAAAIDTQLKGIQKEVRKLRGGRRTVRAAANALREQTVDKKLPRAVQESLERMEEALESTTDSLEALESVGTRFQVLRAQIDAFDERLARAYEVMSLGLTAEAFAHEVKHVVDGLQRRSSSVLRELKKEPKPARVESFVRHVQASVAALRRQLARLEPSLRFARERREEFDLIEFLTSLSEYHHGRWKPEALAIRVVNMGDGSFRVLANRGKFTQIFDNLILNSEHWLRQDLRQGRIERGEILIEVQTPYLWLSDNGRGIEQRVEGSLFEPFVTARRGGRGLGLFLVREFLKSEGCDIDVYPDRNASGRLYCFEMDLSGVADERS
ncbi:MAG: sensor histidine kinase [Polyangiaceae bacterium]